MDDPLNTALVVTGIGMLVLFLSLSLLYGLMYLLTEFTRDRCEIETEETVSGGARERRKRAAVIAVALARAEQEPGAVGATAVQEVAAQRRASPWRAHHHQRQVTRTLRRR